MTQNCLLSIVCLIFLCCFSKVFTTGLTHDEIFFGTFIEIESSIPKLDSIGHEVIAQLSAYEDLCVQETCPNPELFDDLISDALTYSSALRVCLNNGLVRTLIALLNWDSTFASNDKYHEIFILLHVMQMEDKDRQSVFLLNLLGTDHQTLSLSVDSREYKQLGIISFHALERLISNYWWVHLDKLGTSYLPFLPYFTKSDFFLQYECFSFKYNDFKIGHFIKVYNFLSSSVDIKTTDIDGQAAFSLISYLDFEKLSDDWQFRITELIKSYFDQLDFNCRNFQSVIQINLGFAPFVSELKSRQQSNMSNIMLNMLKRHIRTTMAFPNSHDLKSTQILGLCNPSDALSASKFLILQLLEFGVEKYKFRSTNGYLDYDGLVKGLNVLLAMIPMTIARIIETLGIDEEFEAFISTEILQIKALLQDDGGIHAFVLWSLAHHSNLSNNINYGEVVSHQTIIELFKSDMFFTPSAYSPQHFKLSDFHHILYSKLDPIKCLKTILKKMLLDINAIRNFFKVFSEARDLKLAVDVGNELNRKVSVSVQEFADSIMCRVHIIYTESIIMFSSLSYHPRIIRDTSLLLKAL